MQARLYFPVVDVYDYQLFACHGSNRSDLSNRLFKVKIFRMKLSKIYNHIETLFLAVVIEKPLFVIVGLFIIISFLGYKAVDLKIDASAESLLLENDKDLQYTRKVTDRYGVQDFLIIAYTPKEGNVLSDSAIRHLEGLHDALTRLQPVESVLSILDVPLLESPLINYSQPSARFPTETPMVDKKLAGEGVRQQSVLSGSAGQSGSHHDGSDHQSENRSDLSRPSFGTKYASGKVSRWNSNNR